MKAVKYTIISLLALIAIVFICWNLAPGWITSELSKMMGVEVSIGHIGVGTKSVSAENIKIANPKGYKFRDALRMKSLKANTPITNLFHKEIVIDEILGKDMYIDIEFDRKGSTSGNWSVIMGNLTQSLLDEGRKKTEKNVLIRHIYLQNIVVDLVFRRENEVYRLKPIKEIVLEDVSSKSGVPTAQLTNIIIDQMLREIFSINNLMNMLQDILSPSNERSGGFFNSVQSIFSSEKEKESDEDQDIHDDSSDSLHAAHGE